MIRRGSPPRRGVRGKRSLCRTRLATHFVPFAEFETDTAAGTLPDFSLIEPNMLSGEAFLERVHRAYRSATSGTGANVWNTPVLIGWDEPGGTYDHVPPGPVPPPGTWAAITVHPVPDWTMDPRGGVVGKSLSTLGMGIGPALIAAGAQQMGVQLPAELNDPAADLPPRLIVSVLRQIAGHFFPLLAGDAEGLS